MRTTSQKQKLNEIYSDDVLLEIDDETRTKIQQSLLEMFLDIQEVCLRNRIMVYLCGGSALGAVRHKGFIPWDDDIDITMTRAGYNRFRKIFEKELSDKYTLNAPNYSKRAKSRFPKIMKKDTIFRELGDTSEKAECGLFIDIFIMDNVPDNRLHRMIKGSLCNILEFIGGQVALLEADSEWRMLFRRTGRWSYYLRFLCGKVFSFWPASKWYNIIDRKVQHRNNKSMDCSLATGLKHYFGETLQRSEYMPATQVEFEGHKAYTFHDVDAYLSNLYGDYMTIPAPEKRQKHFIKELSL